MGHTPVNAALGKLHGRIDDYVFRQVENKTIVARRSRGFKNPPTAAQVAVHDRFTLAAEYARGVFSDPAKKQWYLDIAAQRDLSYRRLFGRVLSDYFRAPEVIEIFHETTYLRRIGDSIRVIATDDWKVTGVRVKITAEGALVEQGAAVYDAPHWVYTATTAAPAGVPLAIEVVATDRVGNIGSMIVGVPA